ncbi:hypothetical protein [Mangrovibacterium diazotrophicum]|uniref:Uncharacterized protein n=1 Tax=Mangrovibacterium diazotrophicum TaxID=1261403 RepID=A0A419VXN2_9BACT|nr:hypothetical protein [Mangrovibacterium diazotrophicum]RKD87934.1 hypothetical protein BC643_3942 [Mangrovibacterium diazotrophicum]
MNTLLKQNKDWPWIKFGLGWGIFMFLFTTLVLPLIEHETITLRRILIAIPIWLLGGLNLGYLLRKKINKKNGRSNSTFVE